MNLVVKQKPFDGILGNRKERTVFITLDDQDYRIVINQGIDRQIKIVSPEASDRCKHVDLFESLEALLMLFDGQFYPIENVHEDDKDVTREWVGRRLLSYSSADFMKDSRNRLIFYDEVFDKNHLLLWLDFENELDLSFKMVLYCLSSIPMPVDIKCAFLTEAFIVLCELTSRSRPGFLLPSVRGGSSKLKQYLISLIDLYGKRIFKEECDIGRDKFVQMLVNSRNRIAHIKSRQGENCLEGDEYVFYLMKLSLLYRVIIFDLLGISSNLYNCRLETIVHSINMHDAVGEFLDKLNA